MGLKDDIIALLNKGDNLTDREITNLLNGTLAPQQPINIACRSLAEQNIIVRKKRSDGLIGNFLNDLMQVTPQLSESNTAEKFISKNKDDIISEDYIKTVVSKWLEKSGWRTQVAMGKVHGIDIDAYREKSRWIIEAKGEGTLNPMRVNYFLGILGETLQRMSDPNAKYSIALPDIQQFRNLWDKLPRLAKDRTGISAIFVNNEGRITEVK